MLMARTLALNIMIKHNLRRKQRTHITTPMMKMLPNNFKKLSIRRKIIHKRNNIKQRRNILNM